MRGLNRFAVCGVVLSMVMALSACATQSSGPLDFVPAGDHKVWALGDSQAAPAGLPGRGPGWGERLSLGDGSFLMYGAGFISRSSFTGETAGERIAKIVAYEPAEAIIAMIGANDLYYYTAAAVRPEVQAADAIAAAAGVNIVYVTIPPLPIYSSLKPNEAQRIAVNNNLLADFPDRTIDCNSALSDANGHLRAEFAMAPDDLHLNDAGEQALVDCIAAHPVGAATLALR